jgi:DNA-binding MarR family transcriptional regulator
MNHPATSTPARASATPAETNGVDASDAAALARIHAAIHALQRMTEVFQRRRAQLAASVGITEREWRVLDGICSEDFMPSMFARRRESTPAAVSKILRQLIDKRLVDVTVSKADGRQRDYALTAKGHRTMLRLREQREHAVRDVWLALDQEQLRVFTEFGFKLASELEDYAGLGDAKSADAKPPAAGAHGATASG